MKVVSASVPCCGIWALISRDANDIAVNGAWRLPPLPLCRLEAFLRFCVVPEIAIGESHGCVCLGPHPGAWRAAENDLRSCDGLPWIAMLLRVNGEVQVAERVERIDIRRLMEVLHGFLKLSFVQQSPAQVILRDVVGRGDLDDVRPQDYIVAPDSQSDDKSPTLSATRTTTLAPNSTVAGIFLCPAQSATPQQIMMNKSDERQIGIAIGHGLFTHLHQSDHGHHGPQKPEPSHQ